MADYSTGKKLESADEKKYWQGIHLESVMTAISKYEDAARQLITLNSLVLTAFIGIISFSDILKQPMPVRPYLLYLLSPLPCWVVSLALATPGHYPEAVHCRS